MAKKTDELLAEARERLEQCIEAEGPGRVAALDDLHFLSGKGHWPAAIRKQREIERRPCLTVNTLPTFLQQVTNDQRQNTPGIIVHPVDDKADPETAEVLQGMIRHIEYSSNADIAYDTAVNSAAAIGEGYFRIVTEYESEQSFHQVARFKRIRNALSVYFDPFSIEPDGSDARFAFVTDLMPKEEFKRLYPKATVTDGVAIQGIGDAARHWFRDSGVVVAEYYRIEEEAATLCLLGDGSTAWEDELPKGAPVNVVRRRQSSKRVVRWSKITATDELESADIPCRWIPVFPVHGSELDIEGKVQRAGLVRHAKDPARMYNYWMTAATEEVGLRPKIPYIGAEGQFEGHEHEWAEANIASKAYLEYKPVTVDQQLAPPPQRQPMADIPAGVLQMAMHARDNIKATTGIFDASLGARGNETSGVAIRQRERQGDTANFHYTDNLNRTIRHAGRCLTDMIPRIYDTQRVVRVRGADEKIGFAEINTPQLGQDGAIERVLNDLSVGTYDVTVSAGPSYSTLRQEAADAMIQFGQSWPKLMDLAGDKVVKAMDWPGAEEIAERIARTIPPQVRGDEGGDAEAGMVMTPQGPMPPDQAGQMIGQMMQALEQMQGALQEAENGLAKARIDAASREEVARINAVSRQDVEELKGVVTLLAQRMQPPPQLVNAAMQTGPGEPGLVASGADESRAMQPGMDNAQQGTAAPAPDGSPGSIVD